MSEFKIACPSCSTEIELTEQLAGPLVADLRARFAEQIAAKEADAKRAVQEAAARAKVAAKAEVEAETKALAERLAAQDAKVREALATQAEFLKREQ